MRALMGFAMGYMLGAKVGPKGYEELKDAFFTILRSEEFKGLVRAGTTLARDVAGRGRERMAEQLRAFGATNGDLVLAWRRIAESREFETLLRHGAGMLDEVLEQAPSKHGDDGREDRVRPRLRRAKGIIRWRRLVRLGRASGRFHALFASAN